MEVIDLAIILLVLWSAYHGWKQGLLKEVISMCGFFLGLFIAVQLYTAFGSYLATSLSSHAGVGNYLGKALAFILIWIIVPIILGVVANVLTRSLKGLHLGFANSFGGSLVSLVKYLILMSFVFSAMDFVGILSPEKKDASKFYQPVASIVKGIFADSNKPKATQDAAEKSDTVWIPIHHKK